MNRILVVTGMHRSGTSLVANWMHNCGLFMGDEFLKGSASNFNGHFEDMDFLSFHEDILADNNLSYLVRKKHSISIQSQYHEKAKNIIDKRQHHSCWGWKDPRTVLFLDFWKNLTPTSKYVFVFRHFTQVVDSLKRRKGNSNVFSLTWWWQIYLYAEVWRNYNSNILYFIQKHPDECILLETKDVIFHSIDILKYLNSAWKFNFKMRDINTVFKPTHFRNNNKLLYHIFCAVFCPCVLQTYNRLKAISKLSKKSFVRINHKVKTSL